MKKIQAFDNLKYIEHFNPRQNIITIDMMISNLKAIFSGKITASIEYKDLHTGKINHKNPVCIENISEWVLRNLLVDISKEPEYTLRPETLYVRGLLIMDRNTVVSRHIKYELETVSRMAILVFDKTSIRRPERDEWDPVLQQFHEESFEELAAGEEIIY